jgi:EAL domain-containing protein (putative c-di-GMP-specific phosphodiesterase class I)/ActR/RegA family two-component response regulator
MHLLILDDDGRLARTVATIARGSGWSADACVSAADFQACLRNRQPDAIMLDLQLADSDGIQQLNFLGQVKYSGSVVLMSGFDSRVLESAQQVGSMLGVRVVAVMEKPARALRVRELLTDIENDRSITSLSPADIPELRASRRDLILPATIADAIDAGQMELYLQPIVSPLDRAATRAEALIRWRHPHMGLILPDQFVPVAESDLETIDRLTTWVIGEAVRNYRQLTDSGLGTQISINVSGNNLRSLDFPDRLEACLRLANVPPQALALEVTESVATQGSATITTVLTRLRLKGLSLAIDDFGIGSSTLEALRQLPFSTIKIDKGFVGDMAKSRDSRAIVQSTIELAHKLGLTTVAEGVETEATARILGELGSDGLQGYLFSRPLPFAEFVTWLRSWRARAVTEALEQSVVSCPAG